MKSLRLIIEEIDHEDRARPLHIDFQPLRMEREEIQVVSMLLKAVEKFNRPRLENEGLMNG